MHLDFLETLSKMLMSITVSNAFFISIRTAPVYWPFSVAHSQSSETRARAVTVECFSLNPDCLFDSMFFDFK